MLNGYEANTHFLNIRITHLFKNMFYKLVILYMINVISVVTSNENISCIIKGFVATNKRIQTHGYPSESHFIETIDGYVLNLFRIPYSHKLQNSKEYRPAILLQHGVLSNSDCWISSGPDNSLAYLLADAGYDVWLGNARGNIYSRNNTKISVNHPKFWHFDWHEIGTIDIAAMIDYIIQITGQSRIHYAGHSQGTTVYFVLMSERPKYNKKIKSAHMLAPCAFFKYAKWFAFDILAPLVGDPNGVYTNLFKDMEVLPQNQAVNRLVDSFCNVGGQLYPLCQNLYNRFIGDGYQNTNVTSLQILIETHPAGASSNQLIHFIQQYVSHKFRQFDWGEKQNMLIYNQTSPPDYDLKKITAPLYLYSGKNDAVCTPQDVDILVKNMVYLVEDYRIPDPTFNHLDFLVAYKMKELVNEPILRNLRKH